MTYTIKCELGLRTSYKIIINNESQALLLVLFVSVFAVVSMLSHLKYIGASAALASMALVSSLFLLMLSESTTMFSI